MSGLRRLSGAGREGGPTRRGPGRRRRDRDQGGFTLVELLIVVTISPLIVGALGVGLVAMFSLQSSVSNRLSDSGDAQVVGASFQPDVQQAQQITESPTPACGSTGTQLVGLEWDLVPVYANGVLVSSYYNDVVSYVETPSGSNYNLVRWSCVGESPNQTITSTVLSYNLPSNQPSPAVTCTSAVTNCSSAWLTSTSGNWLSTTGVENVTFTIGEPNATEASGVYQYTLAAVPAATATVSDAGGPITINAQTGCNFATPSSGPIAGSLCFLDFSNLLNNPNLLADAETPNSCLFESVAMSGGWTMYFCMSITTSISGEIIQPFALPTWCGAFLGNPGTSSACGATGIYPNFYGVGGEPALYEQGTGAGLNNGGVATIKLSQIGIVNSNGTPATGWQLFSADAESTDNGTGVSSFSESVTWNSNATLHVVSNGYTAANGYCVSGTPSTRRRRRSATRATAVVPGRSGQRPTTELPATPPIPSTTSACQTVPTRSCAPCHPRWRRVSHCPRACREPRWLRRCHPRRLHGHARAGDKTAVWKLSSSEFSGRRPGDPSRAHRGQSPWREWFETPVRSVAVSHSLAARTPGNRRLSLRS